MKPVIVCAYCKGSQPSHRPRRKESAKAIFVFSNPSRLINRPRTIQTILDKMYTIGNVEADYRESEEFQSLIGTF